ncbi:trichohyalin-like [Trematomus bernacchii]|uniref:trichohyalin-like n=1 Tax=Trematomus bernacchii TaxID=40690 RepID=UPI00146ADCB9|nr:trichohyalin-like [Trematomus bernacchii]
MPLKTTFDQTTTKLSMMLLHTDGKPLTTPLRALNVLVFLLLLTHHCRGQSQLIGSPQPIVANLGGDIILPCYLVPAINVADLTLEWTRPDMDPRFVHVMRLGHELVDKKHKLFKGRTSMFTDELKNGNISLKLSNVQLSDQGKYRCFIPELGRQAFVQLVCVSAAALPPVVTLSGLDGQSGGVVLQCESAGWYPEPEVLWLDAEGKLLSAGPPETVRGPDDLYTVSSRVTVEKRPSSSFTCRVQHHNTNHTTQTQIHFPDEFFKLQSSSSSINIGLAVSLAVCILIMLAVSFFFLWREHIFKTKRKSSDEDQFLNEGERGQLMKPDAVHMEALKGNVDNKSKPKNQSEQQLLEEQRRREEAEKEVQTLKEEERRREEAEKEVQTLKEQLQNKKKEVESKESELQDLHAEKQRNQNQLQDLHAEKQRNQNQLQSLKEHLENKNRELGTIQRTIKSISRFHPGSKKEEQKKKKAEAEQEVETLEKKLESRQKETDTNITECEVKEAEVQQLQEEVQRMETSLQTLMESSIMELERSRAAEASSSSSSPFELKILSRNKSQEEERKRREEEELKEEMKRRREEAEEEVSILKEKLQNETREVERLHTDLQRGGEERRRREEEMKEEMKEMTERKKLTDQKHADLWKIEKELKETRSQLEIKEKENRQLKKELNDQLLTEQKREEEARRHLKELLDQNKEFEKKLQEEKRGREEAERELKDLKEEVESKAQAVGYEEQQEGVRSENQTSDSGFNIDVDQQCKYIWLRNTSIKYKLLGGWVLHLQVNDNDPIKYTFHQSFKLEGGRDVTMWAQGEDLNRPNTELVWSDLKPWSSGDRLKFTLFSKTGKMQYERCMTST